MTGIGQIWDYGEVHHFKGPHDDIGCAVKQKVYFGVSTQKILNEDAQNFVIYANTACNINVYYLDKSEINFINVSDSVYIPGILEIHHVVRIGENSLEFYKNSNYKNHAKIHTSVTYCSENQNQHSSGNTDESLVVSDLVAEVSIAFTDQKLNM